MAIKFFVTTMKELSKTRYQIADEYGICTKTLYRWIKEKKLNISKGLLTPKEQKIIYETFGAPPDKI